MEHIHKPLYRFVFRDALILTWKNKYLWVLGFFVALLGNGGMYEVILRGFDRSVLKAFAGGGRVPTMFGALNRVKDFVLESASIKPIFEFVLVVAVLIVLLLLYFFVVSLGMTGVILGTQKLVYKKRVEFLALLRESLPHIPHVFSINLLAKLLIGLAIAGSAVPLGWLLLKSKVIFGFLYVISFVLLICAGLIVSFLSLFAACSAVLQKKHVFSAVKEAWEVFLRNVITSIEMALALFLLNILISIMLVALLISLGGIFGFILTLLAATKVSILFWAFFAIGTLALAALVIAVGSFFGAFQLVSWTLLYGKLQKGGAISKMVRLISGLPHRLRFKKA